MEASWIEITVRVNWDAFRSLWMRENGLADRACRWVFAAVWTVTACAVQVSAGRYFPEWPSAPLALAVSYLAWRRASGVQAVFAAWLGGMLLDAWLFEPFGVYVCSAGAAAAVSLGLRRVYRGRIRRFSGWCLLSGVSVSVAAALVRLPVYGVMSPAGDVLSHVPVYLLIAPLWNGVILAPLQYSLYDGMEGLVFRVMRRPVRGAVSVAGGDDVVG